MTATPIDLTGKAALVTGASSGLGRRFAAVLAGAGAKVALAARRVERLEAVADDLGGEALALAMDVADEASVRAGFDAAEQRLGPIGIVIANAGMSIGGFATDMAAADFDAVMAVNVRGAFLTAREGARRIMAAGTGGRVLLISSIGGLKPLPGLAAYCISKAAVAMMGKALAREWVNRGVAVNVLAPGYIETELNEAWFESEAGKRQIAGFPRRRLMAEEDLDAMVLYLCSEAAGAMTGSVITLDDGQTL